VCVWVLKLSGEWIDKFREVIVVEVGYSGGGFRGSELHCFNESFMAH
jgi:hypothetical protein